MQRKDEAVTEQREGEIALPFDPGTTGDAAIVFIGLVCSAWRERADCPKNMVAAREAQQTATLRIREPYRQGLEGLERASHAIVLTWLDRSARNLIVQKPRHADMPSGVFSLRSPARPNPIGVHVCRVLGVDRRNGIVELDAIDVLDETPLLDIKPYFASTDSFPEAVRAPREASA
ncbi:MAG: tRNA (N6-threonylcarbamoyladenosine(37)-N6)-methyltransferase TrmO [Rhizobiaceae bacterium]